jgi:ketosteroid isomerase-like protein
MFCHRLSSLRMWREPTTKEEYAMSLHVLPPPKLLPQGNELLVRELFAALNEHDLASLQILLSPAAVLHVPGHNVNAGDYFGHNGFLEFWSKVSQRAAGKVEIKVNDILANTINAVALASTLAERRGERLENRVVYVLRFEEGRIAEGWIHNYDQNTVDAFWS